MSTKNISKKESQLTKDFQFLIFDRLSDEDLFNFCLTNKNISKLCRDESFWKNRFINKFGKKYKLSDETWKRSYLIFSTYLDLYPEINLKEILKKKQFELYKYFERKIINDIYDNMLIELRRNLNDLEVFEQLEPFSEEEIDEIIQNENENIKMAIEDMYNSYFQENELIDLQKGVSSEIYRNFLDEFVNIRKYER